jgi:hypothetical protein
MPEDIKGRTESVRRALDELLNRLCRAVADAVLGPSRDPPLTEDGEALPANPGPDE